MSKLIWVRWYPKDAMDGMNVLTEMEELAYRRLLDLIFATIDKLPNDDRALAWSTRMGKRWPAVKKRLLELGKIAVVDGFIRNRRASETCIETASFLEQKSAAGRVSAEVRREVAKTLKNKETTSTVVDLPLARHDHVSSNETVNGRSTSQQSLRKKEERKEESLSNPSGSHPLSGDRRACSAAVVGEAVEVWNSTCGELLPKVQKLTAARRTKLAHRLHDDFGGDVQRWAQHCQRIIASPFLVGSNDRSWQASFDWAIEPGNVVKVAEGHYDRRVKAVQTEIRGAL